MAQHRTRQQKAQAEARRAEMTYSLPPQKKTTQHESPLNTTSLPPRPLPKNLISTEQMQYLKKDLLRTAGAIACITFSLFLVVVLK